MKINVLCATCEAKNGQILVVRLEDEVTVKRFRGHRRRGGS